MQEQIRDYSLVGKESKLSLERGLADARWYTSPIPREKMKELLVRRNGPAIRDTLIWFGLLSGSATLVVYLWGTWWFLLPYIFYTVLYGSTADSRWHEAGHGTAFKSAWMNNVLYEIASFMIIRQSTVWRWSHTRHHSDTLVRGRDPEIAAQRPPNIPGIISQFFSLKSAPAEFKKIFLHATGRIHKEVATFVPESEYGKVFWTARIYLLIIAAAITLSFVLGTPLPFMFVGLPTVVGAWLMPIYGLTQHAGLEENVLDHRLNCRTVYMNRIHRYLYWNMNYHVEHHMFPMVPYHKLPELHKLMKDDCPPPYRSIIHAWREIIPTLRRQVKDPSYFVKRTLPPGSGSPEPMVHIYRASLEDSDADGLVKVCASGDLDPADVIRVDLDDQTLALYRSEEGMCYATDGICTHGNTHLAEGMVFGHQVECPKHNGRFDFRDGSPQRSPVCEALRTYEVMEKEGYLFLDSSTLGNADQGKSLFSYQVVSNQNVATFIKELVLEPAWEGKSLEYRPGEYVKLEIPKHRTPFHNFTIQEPFHRTWKDQHVFHHHAFNPLKTQRNYSMAGNPQLDRELRFNVRSALPPPGFDCDAGLGSSYVFSLKPGDLVELSGPYGDFLLKETDREKVFVGGGAGMAPLRSQISHLLESVKTEIPIHYWYGARSLKELYYEEYFRQLEEIHSNFSFNVALSEPLEEDGWNSFTGNIHEVLEREFLLKQEDPAGLEYYICGPPAMISALLDLLTRSGIPEDQIAFDEF